MIRVARIDELPDRRVVIVDAGEGRRVLLARIGDDVHATEPRCPHARSILGPGPLTEDRCLIECPMHGALFDPVDGVAKRGPTLAGLETYPVELRDGEVHVDLDAARPRPPAPRDLDGNPIAQANPHANAWAAWGSPRT